MNRTEKLAINLRLQLGIPDDEKIDAIDVLRRLKIVGLISYFGPGLNHHDAGVAAQWNPNDRSIRVDDALWQNPNFAEDPEVRFIVGHEIGHVVNGHEIRNRKIGGKTQFGAIREQDETEADEFALAFLIPMTFALDAPIYDANALSLRFGITKKAADRRMVDLQKYARSIRRRLAEGDVEDNYAEAMSEMRKNTLSWNSPFSRSIATRDEDWDF